MWLLIEYNYLYKTKLMWSAEKQNLNQYNHKFPVHHPFNWYDDSTNEFGFVLIECRSSRKNYLFHLLYSFLSKIYSLYPKPYSLTLRVFMLTIHFSKKIK
jgi:hypothetical protein